jgi:hypothetical protein
MLRAIGHFVRVHRQKLREARAYADAVRLARDELVERLRRAPGAVDGAQVALLVNELVERHVAPLVATWDDHPEPQHTLMTARTLLARAAARGLKMEREKAP